MLFGVEGTGLEYRGHCHYLPRCNCHIHLNTSVVVLEVCVLEVEAEAVDLARLELGCSDVLVTRAIESESSEVS